MANTINEQIAARLNPAASRRVPPFQASTKVLEALKLLGQAEAELAGNTQVVYRLKEATRQLLYASDRVSNFIIEDGEGDAIFVQAFDLSEAKAFATLIGKEGAQVSEWEDWSAPELKQRKIAIKLSKSVREFATAIAAEA